MNPTLDSFLKHYSKEDGKIDMENQENMLKKSKNWHF